MTEISKKRKILDMVYVNVENDDYASSVNELLERNYEIATTEILLADSDGKRGIQMTCLVRYDEN